MKVFCGVYFLKGHFENFEFVGKKIRFRTIFLEQENLQFLFLAFGISFLFFFQVVYGESLGTLEISMMNLDGEKISTSAVSIKIYQDLNETSHLEIDEVTSNPYLIESLPLGHTYTAKIFRNGVYASSAFVSLKKNFELVEIKLPGNARVGTTIYYNDGITPIEGAIVKIKSQDGKEWKNLLTNSFGKTGRESIQSVVSDLDYYYYEITIAENISYTSYPFKFLAGAQNIKIVTPWPPVIDKLLTIQVQKNSQVPIEKSDGMFSVLLINKEGKSWESKTNLRGNAYFSLLPVNNYLVKVLKKSNFDTSVILAATRTVNMDGEKDFFTITIGDYEKDLPTSYKNETKERMRGLVGVWLENEIDDGKFLNEIVGFLGKKYSSNSGSKNKLQNEIFIPNWFKDSAKWNVSGQITDEEFINSIKFLIKNRIILY